MRLPGWLTAGVSVCLLLAIGALGWQMNRDAVRGVEAVHRADVASLVTNNIALANEFLALSARELAEFALDHRAELRTVESTDRSSLSGFVARSVFFSHGAALADPTGRLITSVTGPLGLPSADDPGYAPLRDGIRGRSFVFSNVLRAEGTPMIAVAVPILGEGSSHGLMIGYMLLRDSPLQDSMTRLGESTVYAVVDGAGLLAVASDKALLGNRAPDAVRVALARRGSTPVFVEYTDAHGRAVTAVVAGGMRGGWGYFRAQPSKDFYGPVRDRSMRTNLVLLGLIMFAGASLIIVGNRLSTVRRRAEQRFQALVQNSSDCITVLDSAGRITYDSPSIEVVLGFSPTARIGMLGSEMVHAVDRAEVREVFARVGRTPGATGRTQCRAAHHDGGFRWVDLTLTNLLDQPAINGIVINGHDISDGRELQERLAFQATHDLLTGLPNRRLLNERLAGSLRRDPERAPMVAVLFIDLDRFKAVNDSLGHDAGDELLRQASTRLGRCLRAQDLLCRVGGDEFVALLDGITTHDEATAVAARVVAALREPFEVFGEPVTIGASVGVSFNAPGATVDDLLGGADAAMYRAKQAGGLRYVSTLN